MADIAVTIMEERLEFGVEMVKRIAQKHGVQFSEAVFIKGLESGISMFIQKEANNRTSPKR